MVVRQLRLIEPCGGQSAGELAKAAHIGSSTQTSAADEGSTTSWTMAVISRGSYSTSICPQGCVCSAMLLRRIIRVPIWLVSDGG